MCESIACDFRVCAFPRSKKVLDEIGGSRFVVAGDLNHRQAKPLERGKHGRYVAANVWQDSLRPPVITDQGRR